ncbi:MAG: hypothetical protein ACREEW_06230 [Caulobacteraceae bacterium]
MKFYFFRTDAGDGVWINPSQVKRVVEARSGGSLIVFGAFAGGLDQVHVPDHHAEVIMWLNDALSASSPP